jgi:AcrR family transcriptional regulator
MTRPRTRIQQRNSETILEAALEVFSQHGFRGATLDQIAEVAGLSKPNLLYYFASKEAIHGALLSGLLVTWLDPLRAMDPEGDPVAELPCPVVPVLRGNVPVRPVTWGSSSEFTVVRENREWGAHGGCDWRR